MPSTKMDKNDSNEVDNLTNASASCVLEVTDVCADAASEQATMRKVDTSPSDTDNKPNSDSIEQAVEGDSCCDVQSPATNQLSSQCCAESVNRQRSLSAGSFRAPQAESINPREIDEMSGIPNVSQSKAELTEKTFSFIDYNDIKVKTAEILHYSEAWKEARDEYVKFISKAAPLELSKEYLAERRRLVNNMLKETFTIKTLQLLSEPESLNKLLELPSLFLDTRNRVVTADRDPNYVFNDYNPFESVTRFNLTADGTVLCLVTQVIIDAFASIAPWASNLICRKWIEAANGIGKSHLLYVLACFSHTDIARIGFDLRANETILPVYIYSFASTLNPLHHIWQSMYALHADIVDQSLGDGVAKKFADYLAKVDINNSESIDEAFLKFKTMLMKFSASKTRECFPAFFINQMDTMYARSRAFIKPFVQRLKICLQCYVLFSISADNVIDVFDHRQYYRIGKISFKELFLNKPKVGQIELPNFQVSDDTLVHLTCLRIYLETVEIPRCLEREDALLFSEFEQESQDNTSRSSSEWQATQGEHLDAPKEQATLSPLMTCPVITESSSQQRTDQALSSALSSSLSPHSSDQSPIEASTASQLSVHTCFSMLPPALFTYFIVLVKSVSGSIPRSISNTIHEVLEDRDFMAALTAYHDSNNPNAKDDIKLRQAMINAFQTINTRYMTK